jgi:Chitin synthase
LVTIILYAVLFGAQIIIFLARSRFDYLLWFLIYFVLGIPVFYFILPVYSFWNMDDFSWGTTRQVSASKKGKPNTGEVITASSVPKRETPKKSHKSLSTVEEERSGKSGNSRPRMTNDQKAISALTFDDEYPSRVSYDSGPKNYIPQELIRKSGAAERVSVQIPARNIGPIDLDAEPVPIAKKSGSVRSDGPVDLDDSPSPKKKMKDQQFLSFGSFDGEDEVQTFEDLYEGSSEPGRFDV